MGAAFRLADAAGLSQLILSDGSPCPPHPKIARTARSTERSVEWQYVDSAVDFLLHFRRSNPAATYVLALEITDQSRSLFDFQLPEPVVAGQQSLCLLAGAEAQGIPQELLDLCDASVHLPMHGQNTSMNVSVALGAAVYMLLAKWRTH